MTADEPVLKVPARDIPVPMSISEEARAILNLGPMDTIAAWPALDDLDGWRERVMIADGQMLSYIGGGEAAGGPEIHEITVGSARVYVAQPDDAPDGRVVLDIHGGGLIMGGGDSCRLMAGRTADRYGVKLWSVDYRMPPDLPYPAAVDDCLAAYQGLLKEYPAEQIIVSGASAGGNLAAATILRARDEGFPLPNAVVLMSPEIDLTESGDTFATNLGVDTVIPLFMPVNLLYAAGHDLADPFLSPLFGDFTKGFPPTILTSGTRDLFLSNTVRMHRALRRAGVPAELHVQEAAPHGGFFGMAPEDQEINAEILRFLDAQWSRSAARSGPA